MDVRKLWMWFFCLHIISCGNVSPPTAAPDKKFNRNPIPPQSVSRERSTIPPNGILIRFKSDVIQLPSTSKSAFTLSTVTVTDPSIAAILDQTPPSAIHTLFSSQLEHLPATLQHVYHLEFPSPVTAQQLSVLLAQLQQNTEVDHAEPNYPVQASLIPNDPLFPQQWGLESADDHDIEAPSAWDISTGQAQTTIAVLDSGVSKNHPDLAGKLLPGYDFINNDADADDDYGHGTHVSGIVGAISNNGAGIAGIDWNCTILPIKVLDNYGFGYWDQIMSGIIYAADRADIINMSLGGLFFSQLVQDAIDYATSKNLLIVASAMNAATDEHYYPAAMRGVVAVAATDRRDIKASFSNYGSWIDISAPGVDIVSTVPTGHCARCDSSGYRPMSGTSMAAPMVTGALSVIAAVYPAESPTDHLIRLMRSVESIDADNPRYLHQLGVGRLNLHRALTDQPRPGLRLVGLEVRDRDGDQDSLIDAGEIIDLIVSLRGTGLPVQGISTVLSTSDPYATITQSLSSFPDVTFDHDTDNRLLPFTLTISRSLPYGYRLPVTLSITANSFTQVIGFEIDSPFPELSGFPIAVVDTFQQPLGAPIVTNLDGRAGPEIIIPGLLHDIFVYRNNGDIVTGWPQEADRKPTQSLTVLDTTGDNQKEIFLADDSGIFHGWRANGMDLPGFPIQLATLLGQETGSVTIPAEIVSTDLDGDTKPEHLLAARNAKDRTTLLQLDSTGVQKPGWPRSTHISIETAPAVADIQQDGRKEIFFGTSVGLSEFAFTVSGEPFWPSAVTISEIAEVSPVIADINVDGSLEYVTSDGHQLVVKDQTNTPLPGWPIQLNTLFPHSDPLITFIVVGNISSRPGLEIVTGALLDSNGSAVMAFDQFGKLLPGWPAELPVSDLPPSDSHAVIGDIDGDGQQDIVLAHGSYFYRSGRSVIDAWHGDGTSVRGFPIFSTDSSSSSNPVLTDLNQDGRIDLVIGDRGSIHAFDLGARYNPELVDWPMRRVDPGATGALQPTRWETWLGPKAGCGTNVCELINNFVLDDDYHYVIEQTDGITDRWFDLCHLGYVGQFDNKLSCRSRDGYQITLDANQLETANTPINATWTIYRYPVPHLLIAGPVTGCEDSLTCELFSARNWSSNVHYSIRQTDNITVRWFGNCVVTSGAMKCHTDQDYWITVDANGFAEANTPIDATWMLYAEPLDSHLIAGPIPGCGTTECDLFSDFELKPGYRYLAVQKHQDTIRWYDHCVTGWMTIDPLSNLTCKAGDSATVTLRPHAQSSADQIMSGDWTLYRLPLIPPIGLNGDEPNPVTWMPRRSIF